MTPEHTELIGIGRCMTEAESIVHALLFIHEQAEPAQRPHLNDAILTLLCIVIERIDKASAGLDRLSAAA